MNAARNPELRRRIVEAALAAADEVGWERVRLHRLAERCDASLSEIRAEFSDLDAVADAWLSDADDAMLASSPDDGAEPAQRLERALLAWFAALRGRRRTLRAILAYRLSPLHLHLQAALVVATSRRVQWLREAARLDAAGLQKQVEEAGLTALFVAATVRWLRDGEEGRATAAFVRRRLASADSAMRRVFKPR